MAVYTEVTDEEVQAFIRHYDLGDVLFFKGIAEGVENSNYLLETSAGRFILTLYEKRVAREDLPYFLGLMEHLESNGIACPRPVHGRDGKVLRDLCGRPAALISFLEGLWPKHIRSFHCRALGRALANMHVVGESFPMVRPNTLSLGAWRDLLERCRGRADEIAPGLGRFLEEELAILEGTWPDDLPRGVIHADLFPDNVFFKGETLTGLIDFYFACNDFLAYDLAVCLNAWCFESDFSFNVTKARLLFQSYREVRPLTSREVEMIPVMARGSAMRFLLTRLYDWLHHPDGAFVKPKDPMEYYLKLRFHRDARGPEAYCLES